MREVRGDVRGEQGRIRPKHSKQCRGAGGLFFCVCCGASVTQSFLGKGGFFIKKGVVVLFALFLNTSFFLLRVLRMGPHRNYIKKISFRDS